MLDLIVVRLLPALVFGCAAGGLLWLLGLIRKRAALTAAVTLGVVFVAGRWPATLLVMGQISLIAVAGRILHTHERLRSRDVFALTAAAALATWGHFTLTAAAYWDAAIVGALAGAATSWTTRAASERWPEARYRLLTLRRTAAGGASGIGVTVGMAMGVAVVTLALSLGRIGPGEPALALVGGLLATIGADFIVRQRPGLVLVAGFLGGVLTAGLVAYLP